MEKLIDKFSRRIDYLRISVTDRCNLRCIYCMPAEGITQRSASQILSFEQIYRIVKIASQLGIRKVRLTGGEPLARKGLPSLIKKLKTIKALDEIVLTTNGVYLSKYAFLLKEAGLDRVNISLDSLIPERFCRITRGGSLEAVLSGIDAALAAGLCPVKINIVLLEGFNTDELLSFANLAKTRPLHVRFIEYMPTFIVEDAWPVFNSMVFPQTDNHFFSAQAAKDICETLGILEPEDDQEISPARVYRIKGFQATVGFISALSQPFCRSCNKLRLTSGGILRGCLHSARGVNLNKAITLGASDEEIAALIKEAVALKPKSHNLSAVPLGLGYDNFSMCQIGG